MKIKNNERAMEIENSEIMNEFEKRMKMKIELKMPIQRKEKIRIQRTTKVKKT
jgi:hypothetical protein